MLQVEYGLSDIQGNTFASIGGKPFLDLRPIPAGTLPHSFLLHTRISITLQMDALLELNIFFFNERIYIAR